MNNDVTTWPAEEIRGLIEERERYESWLTALEARRGATPSHVFDRVREDYGGRLKGVQEKLGAHVGPLREAEGSLARQYDDVARSLGERQDSLAELELRTLVGEFDPEDGERRVQEAAAAVRELDAQRRSATERLTELRALLQRVNGAGASTEASAPSTAATPESSPSAPTTGAEPTPVTAAEAERSEPESSGEIDDAARSVAGAANATSAQTPARSSSGNWPAVGEDESFVGTGPRLDSLAASLGGAVAPPAPAAAPGQERTLRCQDCGEMNYPTEWYCERCGGELAAL